MIRRNREINTINLSMLDVISGAMAAFLILIVILLPYYRKEHIDYQAIIADLRQQRGAAESRAQAAERSAREAAQTAAAATAEASRRQAVAQAAEERARAAAAQAQAQAAQAAARDQRERAEALARELAKTFLVLYIRWDTQDDVDLHIVDPSGAEFSYQHKTIDGRPGELSEDNIVGPGNEVWEVRNAPPGDYRVLAVIYSVRDARKPVVVRGRLFHRDGSDLFPEVRLRNAGDRAPIVTVRVDAQGDVGLLR